MQKENTFEGFYQTYQKVARIPPLARGDEILSTFRSQSGDPSEMHTAEGQFAFVGICESVGWVGGRLSVCLSVRRGHVVHLPFVSLTVRGVTEGKSVRVRATP